MAQRTSPGQRWKRGAVVASAAVLALGLASPVSAQSADPRAGLAPGTDTGTTDTVLRGDAAQAALNLTRLGGAPKPAYTTAPGGLNGSNLNSDIAFTGDHAIVGNYQGFGIYDVSDPTNPTLQTTVNCPGSQNDVSVYGDLLFLSVEQTTARVDCSTDPTQPVFRGVRIFDISDKDNPKSIAGVQTCKGSHTHTIVTQPGVTDKIWLYVSGTAGVRSATQLAGCNGNSSLADPTTANFRIDVIEVPLAAPAMAKVVSGPRIFSVCGSSACEGEFASGALNGLSAPGVQPTYPAGSGREPGGQRVAQSSACHDITAYPEIGLAAGACESEFASGALNGLSAPGVQPTYPAGSGREPGGQRVAQSSACHDITAYPEIGLAAGACQGDGLLLDISDPVNPVRIDNVTDYNFAYWHSATFNNDGTKVVFTDEWGGGSGARCQPSNPENWGANAIFDIVTSPEGKKTMEFASYYSIPNVQSATENCVAHNGSLVPVPGRDIMVQAWYQGGLSVFDFTDSKNPTEMAFFDRGPIVTPTTPTGITLGGFWSTYWNNGSIIGSEIRLGTEAFGLNTSSQLSANELAAAKLVTNDELNVQSQQRITWEPSFTVVRARYDQAVRDGSLSKKEAAEVVKFVDRAEGFAKKGQKSAGATLRAKAGQLTGAGQAGLASELERLADSL